MLVAFIWITSLAYAREDLIPGSRYTAARGAAMGDAFLPLGGDPASALFYNPAELSKLRRFQIEPVNISGEVNSGFLKTADLNFYRMLHLKSYLPTLQKSPGVYSGFGGQILPNFGFQGFGFGILGLSQVGAQVSSNSLLQYRSLMQVIPAIGFGFQLFEGMVRLGYSLQWVNQASGLQTVDLNTTSDVSYNQKLLQGAGLSHQVGMGVLFPVRYLPALNLVIRNLLGTRYRASWMLFPLVKNSLGVPNSDPMTFDASVSFRSHLGNGALLQFVLEDRDITNRSGMIFLGHLAAGIELNFKNHILLRGGWGSGYPSLGLGLRQEGRELAIAWYTEEIGTSYRNRGDTRIMLQYQWKIF